MSFALSGLIIAVVLLPGIIFRAFLIKTEGFEKILNTSSRVEIGIILFSNMFFYGS